MDYRSFITMVERVADVPGQEAERSSCLTLHTLAQRVSLGEAEHLAERLPEELRPCAEPEGPLEKFHVDEFLERIENGLAVDRPTAEREAVAVLAALRTAVGTDEFADMRAQLPSDFDPLLDEAVAKVPPPDEPTRTEALPLDDFLRRVGERTGLGPQAALRAAQAVLEVLAVRITAGQVKDMEPFLPPELRAAMERGLSRGGSRAVPLSADSFLERVARLEGVTRAEASEHVRAVFSVLREAVGEKEFHDMVAQLPGEYRPLLRQG